MLTDFENRIEARLDLGTTQSPMQENADNAQLRKIITQLQAQLDKTKNQIEDQVSQDLSREKAKAIDELFADLVGKNSN